MEVPLWNLEYIYFILEYTANNTPHSLDDRWTSSGNIIHDSNNINEYKQRMKLEVHYCKT